MYGLVVVANLLFDQENLGMDRLSHKGCNYV